MKGIRERKVPPKEGSTLDCACDEEATIAGEFKDNEKELELPEVDAGVLATLKPVNPEVGVDAVVPGADIVNAGKVKPELAVVPAEDALVEAGAEALVVVVVVTVENRVN